MGPNYILKTQYLYVSSEGFQTFSIPKGSYVVGVATEDDVPVLAFWEPSGFTEHVSLRLYIACDNHQLGGDEDVLNPRRLRHLGNITALEGAIVYFVFEVLEAENPWSYPRPLAIV